MKLEESCAFDPKRTHVKFCQIGRREAERNMLKGTL